MKHKIEVEIDVPEGYEATGEYRVPIYGELFLSSDSVEALEFNCSSNLNYKKFILRKVEPEQPEYKSFEIDWSGNMPKIFDYLVEVGRRYNGYRIFGFGDNEEYKKFHCFAPCTPSMNYKYAYGRLEK